MIGNETRNEVTGPLINRGQSLCCFLLHFGEPCSSLIESLRKNVMDNLCTLVLLYPNCFCIPQGRSQGLEKHIRKGTCIYRIYMVR